MFKYIHEGCVISIKHTIEVASCTVTELFSEKITDFISGTLQIPEYQRPYKWTTKEIKKLLSDIKEHNNNPIAQKPMYYLGSITLHKHDNKLAIIDGQQRITTLAIIQHIKDINKVPKVKYVSPTTIEHIKENYNYLKNYDLNYISFDNLNVTLVVTGNTDDAYTFFETQNTGGIRLSGIDIIKAHHLREISNEGKREEKYAIIWEKQKNIETVIGLLIKARRWNFLNWEDVPSNRDEKSRKNSIITDFSEKTLDESQKIAYSQIISTKNYTSIKLSPFKFSIRQPLANGENFIDFLEQFAELYKRLFTNNTDYEICNEYYNFEREIIRIKDGTAFLKELYEIAILCYCNKFGVDSLLEASYWIFRYTYSLRVSNRKTVRENSIPAFLKEKNYILDIIIASFNHEQLIEYLRQFNYEFNTENTEGNTVKWRFIKRVKVYFNKPVNKDNYDSDLKDGIACKLEEVQSGK